MDIYILRFALLFFVVFSLSCGLKQPVDRTPIHAYGRIFVSSNPAGGLIYLDGQSTLQFTPDTLQNINPGSHIIHIVLDEHRSRPDSAVVDVKDNETVSAFFELEKIEISGFVVVASNPPGADIYIDNQNSGNTTPDTLQLPPGSHHLEILKNGYTAFVEQVHIQRDSTITLSIPLHIQPCVLLEAFGNVSCAPCVEAAHNLHTFADNTQARTYAIIEYYANWPSPNDPFYLEAPQDVKQRLLYYQVSALPTLLIGGASGVDAARYEDIEQTFTAVFAAQSTPIGLSIRKTLVNGLLTVNVEAIPVALDQDLNPLRLYAAVVEDGIHYETPPGSNGLTNFDYVFRGFLSDKAGDPFEASQQQQNFIYTLPWPEDWVFSNTHIVVFIQHREKKQILHASIN